ncbi:response regulator [Asticcacaulis sp. EMRT-3]|uniref:response regulator n=1 Tax=Asticcacaulis sp. EMRT-3 TaxID=3040349 RepID=UPI0024AED53C|nr:response regulator [Asticcacaulis sp. EMRT-3]MDI7773907.1 response regulator [Asticcacaulis sp. EMRT-3]
MNGSHFVDMDSARILVADDDPILREFAATHLATSDVEVELAEDGEAAWQRLMQGGIDIALVDLEMPRLDGFGLIERVRWQESLKHLPLVVVTGREDMTAIDRAFALGATSFVVKPLNWRLLLHELAYVLRSSRAEADVRADLEKARRACDLKDRVLRLSRQKIMTPLTTIIDAAEAIEKATDNPAIRMGLTTIADATVRLTQVHNDMAEAEKFL